MTTLQVQNITTTFGALRAVDDVSLELHGGQIFGLIGPNGAGKTTLFNTISGAIRPAHGTITLDGVTISSMPVHRVARLGIARTYQLSKPFGQLSVLDNVLVGAWLRSRRRTEAQHIANEALERVGFAHRAETPANDLTAADRKRLDLARCLATRPKVLLVDEVVAGLSETEMQEILELLRGLRAEGVAIIMVEHLLRAVFSVADHVLVLGSGKLIAEGRPQEIVHDQRAIDLYLGPDADVASAVTSGGDAR
jgi:branched-chain amino acid transport system ATP-binding protein